MSSTNDYMNKVIRTRDSKIDLGNVIFRWKNGRVIPIRQKEYKIPSEQIKKVYQSEENKKYNGRRVYIVETTPDDFLKLTTNSEMMSQITDEVKSLSEYKVYKTSASEALNNGYAFLEINMTTGRVVGHEGRHRMLGLKNEGYKKAEIIVFAERGTLPNGFKQYNYKKVSNQINEDYHKTIFEKMIPVNEEYINKIKK